MTTRFVRVLVAALALAFTLASAPAIAAGAADPVAAWIAALRGPDAIGRWTAAYALGTLGPSAGPEAAVALRAALPDADEDVRAAAAWALVAVDPAAAREAPGWDETIATIERLTPRLMDELRVPGVSIALLQDGRLAWAKAWGVADAATRAPVTTETLFEAASMSKPVFAYAVLQLVDRGELTLDRPLVAWHAEPAFPDQPERRQITARMALTHTTGFPNWRKGDDEPGRPLPLLFEPGARFGYSGEGIFYLQRVVETITARPLDAWSRGTLLDPLGLASTSFSWSEALDPRLATGHGDDGAPLPRARYARPNAAYTLITTPSDYARFLAAILAPERGAPWALSRRSHAAMLSHQVKADARAPIQRPGRARGLATFWGLGWGINSTPSGDIVYHSGSNQTGFRSYAQFSPARGSGIVIMTNGTGGAELWARLVSAVGDL
ncbi:MAG: beta-lactamase family protein [Acidobacteria bacterium]|nr:beta-lactamase family protein [Acidobacteriota bacterium]